MSLRKLRRYLASSLLLKFEERNSETGSQAGRSDFRSGSQGCWTNIEFQIKSCPHPVASSTGLGADSPREDSCGLHLLRGKSGRAEPSVLLLAPLHFTPSAMKWLRL